MAQCVQRLANDNTDRVWRPHQSAAQRANSALHQSVTSHPIAAL